MTVSGVQPDPTIFYYKEMECEKQTATHDCMDHNRNEDIVL
jgi:hypothetical protein